MKEDLCTAVVLTHEDPIVSLAFHTLANLATLYTMRQFFESCRARVKTVMSGA